MKVSEPWFYPYNNRHEIIYQVSYPTGRITNCLGNPPEKKEHGKITAVFKIRWKENNNENAE